MLHFALAIFFSAAIAVLFKLSESARMNRYVVTAANYVAASLTAGLLLLGLSPPERIAIGPAVEELATVFRDPSVSLSAGASIVWAIALGLAAGAFFFLGFVYYQLSVNRHGVALAGAFMKLGILVPMFLSLALWREYPEVIQWLGIALALAALALVNWPRGRHWSEAIRPALLLLCLFGGVAEFSNKVYQKYGLLEYKSLFLLVTFAVALACSLIAMWIVRARVRPRAILMGLAVGVANFFCAYFIILSLVRYPAALFFPVYAAGSIVLINLAGVVLFRERLSRIEWASIALTILAVVLINL